MRRYALVTEITDDRPGWPVPPRRVLPRAYTIRVQRYVRNDGDRARELTDAELAELVQDPERAGDWLVGYRNWLVLSVETSATQPPRCVTLHAPRGIGTPELRFPLAGIVTEASAMLASRKRASGDPPGPLGQHLDLPGPIEYEDVVWELGRTRGRKRSHHAVTEARLAEAARIAAENPRTPTAAVQHHFKVSRGYARRLIKLAQEKEDTNG